MSLLSMRFRHVAAQCKISDMAAKELQWEQIIPLLAEHLTKRFLNAISQRVDLNDLITVWNLLNVDAVIRLENERGESIRVAVAVSDRNNKAYSIYRSAQNSALTKVRHLLGIEQYWVFCVNEKLFPSQEKWIDLLYEKIDLPEGSDNCRLINTATNK